MTISQQGPLDAIQVGDVVKIKTGRGPKLTVLKRLDPIGAVEVGWFQSIGWFNPRWDLYQRTVPYVCLRKVR